MMTKNKRAKIERPAGWDEEERMNTENQFGTSYPQERKSAALNGMFRDEVKAMLYVYGDVRHPLAETVVLVEEILYAQACELLVKSAEIALLRSSDEISVEEFLFLLRRDPGKLNRFVARMKLLDSHMKMLPSLSKDGKTGDDIDFSFPEANSLKRYKRCVEFLRDIDDTGELGFLAQKSSLDGTKIKRMERAEKQTRDMSTEEYMEFVKLRRIGFTTKKNSNYTKRKQLKDWFDLEKLGISAPISDYGWDAVEYLAQETVAEIVDKALLVRSETMTPLIPCEIEPNARHLPLYAFSTLVGRAEILGDTPQQGDDGTSDSSNKTKEGPLDRKLALTPSDIREAMRRFSSDSRGVFLSNVPRPATRKLLCID